MGNSDSKPNNNSYPVQSSNSQQPTTNHSNGYNNNHRPPSGQNRNSNSIYPNLNNKMNSEYPYENGYNSGYASSYENHVINDQTLKRFIEILSEVEQYEKKGVFDGLRIAEEEFDTLEKNKRKAEINLKVLIETTKKEKQDYDNIVSSTVEKFYQNKFAHNEAITREQQEYFQALNLQEIAENELKTLTQQYEHSKEKLAKYKQENHKAIELYNEQMNILNSTFDGDYGSDLENTLEKEVKSLTEQKEKLRSALHKWSNAKFLLVYAYNQIQTAEQKWSEIMRLKANDKQKVILATEVRNNLVAANQNLCNIKSYLKNIDLPYCTEDDLKSLQNLASNTYKDMLTVDRQNYVYDIIQALRKRCAALNQWFDSVIKDSLIVEYSKVKIDFDQQTKALKMERIRLLQEKIKEKTGQDVKVNLFDFNRQNTNINDKMNMNSSINQPFKATEDSTLSNTHEIHEKPISSYDLPPPPSRDQILGNVEKIKQQYFKQVEDWNKQMDSSRREADEKLNKMLAKYKNSANSTESNAE